MQEKTRTTSVARVINRGCEQNQHVDIHSLLIVDKRVSNDVQELKENTAQERKTVDNFHKIVEKSKSFTDYFLFTGRAV